MTSGNASTYEIQHILLRLYGMDPMDLVNASGRGKWNVFAWLQVSPIEGVVVVFCKLQHPFQRVHILDDLEITRPYQMQYKSFNEKHGLSDAYSYPS